MDGFFAGSGAVAEVGVTYAVGQGCFPVSRRRFTGGADTSAGAEAFLVRRSWAPPGGGMVLQALQRFGKGCVPWGAFLQIGFSHQPFARGFRGGCLARTAA